MTITYVNGDATDPQLISGNNILVHVCNNLGRWGAGFTGALSRKWKLPEEEYRKWARQKDPPIPFELGRIQIVEVEYNSLSICNLIGQEGLRGVANPSPVRYESISQGLSRLESITKEENEILFHMPRIGCGLAGGSWDKIEPILQNTLIDKGRSVIVYDL